MKRYPGAEYDLHNTKIGNESVDAISNDGQMYTYGNYYPIQYWIAWLRERNHRYNGTITFVLADFWTFYCHDWLTNPLECFIDIKIPVALDRKLRPGYNNLLLRLIPVDLYSACLHIQFHTLPVLLDIRVAMPNFYTNTIIFMMVFGIIRSGANPRPTAWEVHTPTTKPSWYDRGANPRPNAWEVDTLTTKPTWRDRGMNSRPTASEVDTLST